MNRSGAATDSISATTQAGLPVSGSTSNRRKQTELTERMRKLERAAAAAASQEDSLTFFPRPGGSEMISRWDMQAAPPDVLITNYSMLNIMMMRELEDDIFRLTKEWLYDRDNVFTLVGDELHMYRGTAGTEVGYMLRNLLSRIGILDHPEQLRIITTSASIESDEKGRGFLAELLRNRPVSIHLRSWPPRGAGW